MVDKYVTINIEKGAKNSTLDYNFKEMARDNYLINKLSRFGYWWQTKQQFSDILASMSGKLREEILKEIEKKGP